MTKFWKTAGLLWGSMARASTNSPIHINTKSPMTFVDSIWCQMRPLMWWKNSMKLCLLMVNLTSIHSYSIEVQKFIIEELQKSSRMSTAYFQPHLYSIGSDGLVMNHWIIHQVLMRGSFCIREYHSNIASEADCCSMFFHYLAPTRIWGIILAGGKLMCMSTIFTILAFGIWFFTKDSQTLKQTNDSKERSQQTKMRSCLKSSTSTTTIFQ